METALRLGLVRGSVAQNRVQSEGNVARSGV